MKIEVWWTTEGFARIKWSNDNGVHWKDKAVEELISAYEQATKLKACSEGKRKEQDKEKENDI